MTGAAVIIFALFVVKIIIHIVQTPAATNALGITNAPVKPYKQSKFSKIIDTFWAAVWLLGAVGFLLDIPLRYYDVFMALFLLAAAFFSSHVWYKPKPGMTKREVARLIKAFIGVEGKNGQWDWDDFTSVSQPDPDVELIRRRIQEIPDNYPPDRNTQWCNPQGIQVLLEIAETLLTDTQPPAPVKTK